MINFEVRETAMSAPECGAAENANPVGDSRPTPFASLYARAALRERDEALRSLQSARQS